MRWAAILLILLAALRVLAACGGTPDKPSEQPPTRPDERALAIPTVLRAATVQITLGDHWRDRIQLKAIHIDRTNPAEWVARGGPEFKLGKFDIKARDEIRVAFLTDHEHIVVYARDVQSLARHKGFTHRNEDISLATIADEELSVFSR